jgi:hypothetical protein
MVPPPVVLVMPRSSWGKTARVCDRRERTGADRHLEDRSRLLVSEILHAKAGAACVMLIAEAIEGALHGGTVDRRVPVALPVCSVCCRGDHNTQ